MMHNAPNPFGVLRSKGSTFIYYIIQSLSSRPMRCCLLITVAFCLATGEPPLCMSVAVLFAIKNAIKAARKDAGNTDYFELSTFSYEY